MDNTFVTFHPNEAYYLRRRQPDHFLKGITKLFTKKITKKAAKQAGLSDAQTKELNARTQKAISSGALGEKINKLNTQGNVVAALGATALTAGLASGAIAAPAIGAKIAAAGGALTAGAKKIGSKVLKPASTTGKTALGGAIESLKNVAKEKAPELLQGLKEKGVEKLADIIGNNQTSPELLPKTANQKRMERDIMSGKTGGQSMAGFVETNMPLLIGALLVVVVLGLIFRNK